MININYVKETGTALSFGELFSYYSFEQNRFFYISMHNLIFRTHKILSKRHGFPGYPMVNDCSAVTRPCNNIERRKYEILYSDMYFDMYFDRKDD